MQLHECLILGIHRPTADASGVMIQPKRYPGDRDSAENYQTFLTDIAAKQNEHRQSQFKYTQGSIISMLQCILHEWGNNAKTNFYIPPENYAGYSYLCDECKQSGWSARNIKSSFSYRCNTRSNCHGHHHSAFVHAEQLNSLNLHHHEIYSMRANTTLSPITIVTSVHSPPVSISLANDSFHGGLYHHNTTSSSTTAPHRGHNHKFVSTQMTVPYFHPNLELPVPPLRLPLYFGILCWSFAFAGVLMLRLPQKWTTHGGRSMHSNRQVKISRHWFPYRAFAWVLILWQVSR